MFDIQVVNDRVHIITDNIEIADGLREENIYRNICIWFPASPSQDTTTAIVAGMANAGINVENWGICKETGVKGWWTIKTK